MRSITPAALGAILLALALESGCSTLPSAGPSARTVAASHAVEVVDITPADAQAQDDAMAAAQKAAIDRALSVLADPSAPPAFTFGPGATLGVTLWSFSARPDAAAGPGPTALGSYTVSADGTIVLPYVGQVNLSGLTLEQAQDAIGRRYVALRMFQDPSIAINVSAAPQGHVTVTGAVGQPRIIPWTPEGITLADALTQSLGDGASLLGQPNDLSNNISAIRITILRDSAPPVELPISVALERKIALRPDDRVVVKKAPAVEVTVLGAGVQNNGVLGFAEPPPLSDVLAKASGLNSNVADNHAVFVLRERQGQRPVLYDFAWSRTQGLIASHRFPVENGDMIYVAEAPIISVQRVINILFQVALPAQVLK